MGGGGFFRRAMPQSVGEQVLVWALVPEASLEALNEAVLHGFAWCSVVPLHLACLLPSKHSGRRQIGAIVADHHAEITAYLSDPVQPAGHAPTANGCVHHGSQALPAEAVDHAMDMEPSTISRGIRHAVGRPAIVGALGRSSPPLWSRLHACVRPVCGRLTLPCGREGRASSGLVPSFRASTERAAAGSRNGAARTPIPSFWPAALYLPDAPICAGRRADQSPPAHKSAAASSAFPLRPVQHLQPFGAGNLHATRLATPFAKRRIPVCPSLSKTGPSHWSNKGTGVMAGTRHSDATRDHSRTLASEVFPLSSGLPVYSKTYS